MGKILIVGSGISGLSAAISLAQKGKQVLLLSPYASERSQSVMAMGGINAALNTKGEGDSPNIHKMDTLKGGRFIANEKAVEGLCNSAPTIIKMLVELGVVFTLDEQNRVDLRAFGGQTNRRTAYAGASTGKQIVSALARKCREYEASGRVVRMLGSQFLYGLIQNGVCYGALLYDIRKREVYAQYADAVIMACGGQNTLFGKTTGSMLCDGSAAAALFAQGVALKNLEFIQYHPTTIETSQKRMLISEAARGEGGRLFYLSDAGQRVYFMEDKYGEKGNLMPRDVVSKEIYDVKKQVYLDITFLGKELIQQKLSEIDEICLKYAGLDVSKEPIPVRPSVHFFMGGLWVNRRHETNIKDLYAVGECASIYHGANRLGGNSLLAAVYSGQVAADSIAVEEKKTPDFTAFITLQKSKMLQCTQTKSKFPVVYILNSIANIMNEDLGITRCEETLLNGIAQMDFYLDIIEKIHFDSGISPYQTYAIGNQILLCKAILLCAQNRKESRGSHIREDYPLLSPDYEAASIVTYEEGKILYQLEKDVL